MKYVYDKQHDLLSLPQAEETCWLLANGLGGYASTSAAFSVTRNDQGLLIAAKTPNQRFNLVHRLSEKLSSDGESVFLSSQTFGDGTPPEDGWRRLSSFVWEDGPCWLYQADSVQVTRRCAMEHGKNASAVVYTVENRSEAPCTLRVTPVFQFSQKGDPPQAPFALHYTGGTIQGAGLTLHVKSSEPLLPLPQTWENLSYEDDRKDGRRETGLGLTCAAVELTVPQGESGQLELVFSTEPSGKGGAEILLDAEARQHSLLAQSGFKDPAARELARSADAFIANRPSSGGKTILAGYPFFGDWGRDTMIALPGCVLATKQYDTAKSILRTFLAYEQDGLVPNLFPEGQEEPRYNTVDAALLLINCVWLYYQKTDDRDFVREAWPVMVRIVHAYRTGTHHAIGMDTDGLIFAGKGMDQVTWMDVCVDGILPTPRHGKPVEINAYWYNALRILQELALTLGEDGTAYGRLAEQVKMSFTDLFWMEEKGYLKDVVSGTGADEQLRCNQIWAVTMPFTMLPPAQEQRVVESVRRHLYTPFGLRTLSPEDPEFHPFYGGSQRERDMAYHQGTVWPYPLGAYYLAWLKTHGSTAEAAAQVREQLGNMEAMLREGCVGQLPEIYDGGNPGPSKGCFAQAWSVGELLRVYEALEQIEEKERHS
ncbi:MAG: glycogen debranching protein [Oscillospiraceae bacterium]|jgi:predicted glycogen debranching enzyme|nr:glycogen debranching protein [Oscillospiraceae bacterium]